MRQWRELEDPSVSWVGDYLKYEDSGPWPLLFIYSKKDRLIDWRFISGVVAEQEARGRRVTSLCLEGSGHVAHLKSQPELYTNTIKHFLQHLDPAGPVDGGSEVS